MVMLENLAPAVNMNNPTERREIFDDVYSEAVKCGPVGGVAVPVPPADMSAEVPNRVYVKYHNVDDAKSLKVRVKERARLHLRGCKGAA